LLSLDIGSFGVRSGGTSWVLWTADWKGLYFLKIRIADGTGAFQTAQRAVPFLASLNRAKFQALPV
jgi:hypothetical protein